MLGVTALGRHHRAPPAAGPIAACRAISWPGMQARTDIAQVADGGPSRVAASTVPARGRAMIPRYAPEEMAALFSDEARFAMWLEVELLATDGWVEVGEVPRRGRRRLPGPGPGGRRRLRRGGGRARAGHRPRRGRLRRRGAGGHRPARGLVDPLRPHLVGRGGHRPVRHPHPGRRPAHRRRPGRWWGRSRPGPSSASTCR